MNFRILVYLNPSNINKVNHKFDLDKDSGWLSVKNDIINLNKISKYHFYILIPDKKFWKDAPNNVTLIEYPYINDALNSRYHFDTVFLNNYFSTYKHDIDLIWTMLPENVANFKAWLNKRREEIPIFSYSNWLNYKEENGYFPNFKLRTLEGIIEGSAFGIQSKHMLNYLKELFKEYDLSKYNIQIINPATEIINIEPQLKNMIGFPHRISTESNWNEFYDLVKDVLKYKIWVTNINGVKENKINVIYRSFLNWNKYIKNLANIRFGISYHIDYSMWSMSVLDMMMCGKVVLAPNANAFPEMFGSDYPFLFNDKKEFLEKFKQLQDCDERLLIEFGSKNRERVEKYFSYKIRAQKLKDLFENLISKEQNKKSKNVYSVIKKYNAISKGDLINKNLTEFGRLCSRSWNKTRTDLLFNYNVKDDTTKTETVFYIDDELYKQNGKAKDIKKIMTQYEKRLRGVL